MPYLLLDTTARSLLCKNRRCTIRCNTKRLHLRECKQLASLQAFDQLDNPLHRVLLLLLLVGSHASHKEHEEVHDTHTRSRASSRFVSSRSARSTISLPGATS